MGAAASEDIINSQQGSERECEEPQAEPTPPGQYANHYAGQYPGQYIAHGDGYGGAATRRPHTAPNFQGDASATGTGMNRFEGRAAGHGDNENGGQSLTRKEAARRQLAAMQAKGQEMMEGGRERINSATYIAKKKAMEAASDKTTQVVAASGLGGAVVVGAGGAGVGLLTGGAAGAAIGLLPALFTFGLSIPLGAVIGATCGTVVGAATGGTVGVTGGSAIGYVAYKKRAGIRTFVINFNINMGTAINRTHAKITYYAAMVKNKVVDTCTKTHAAVNKKATALKEKVTRAARSAKANTKEIVTDKKVQRAAASGVAGAVALGAGGAAAGTVTGGTIGAAVGLVPALFTFGLSIPFCAVVGGGCGLAAGGAVGSTTGAVAGVSGYAAYNNRAAIREAIRSTIEKAGNSVNSVADQAGLGKVTKDVQKSAKDLSDNVQRRLTGSRDSPSRSGRSQSPYGC